MSSHTLNNFKIQKYYQNEPKFNGVYSRNNLPKIKDVVYLVNLAEYKSIWTHWIAWYINGNNVKHFNSCVVEHIPKVIKNNYRQQNIETNIYRIQVNDSIICEYFCIGFIDFMSKGKSLLNYTNLLSRSEYGKNDEIILKYFH